MKIFLTTAYPVTSVNSSPSYLKESYNNDPFKVHEVTEDPKDADIIIFAETHLGDDPFFFEVLKNKIYKRYKRKCYLYHDNDRSITLLPTVTPSLELKDFNPVFNLPFPYLIQHSPNNIIRRYSATKNKRFLFSFVGAARTNPIRKSIVNIKYESCYLSDTSGKNSWELSANDKYEYEKKYAEVCFESKFILCPRGLGPSSYRLYEALEMGIAPVIISDEWVPVAGPEWEEFSIRIPEADIEKIPEILERKEPEYFKMGQLARQAWNNWFSKDKQFHYLAEACLRLHYKRNKVGLNTYLKQFARFFEPFYTLCLFRYFKNKIVTTFSNTKQVTINKQISGAK